MGDREIAEWRSYRVTEFRWGGVADYRLRWLRGGGVMEMRGTELQASWCGLRRGVVTELRDNT